MKIGIFSQYYNGFTPEEMARRIRADGYDCVQLYLHSLAEVPDHPSELNESICARIRNAFALHNVEVATIGAFDNIAHVIPAKRQAAFDLVRDMCKWAKLLGTDIVSTMSGSLNASDEWSDHPDNHTEESLKLITGILSELGAITLEHGLKLCVEPYYFSIADTAERMLKVLNAAGPNVGVMYDPAAMVGPDRIHDSESALRHDFQLLFDRFQIAHVENVSFHDGQPDFVPAERGSVQISSYYRLLREYGWTGPLVIENAEDVVQERGNVLAALAI